MLGYPTRTPPRVDYHPTLPREIRAAVAPILPALLRFVPTEHHVVHVAFDADKPSGEAAEMATSRAYRRVTLTLGPAFLEHDDAWRFEILLHEFAHTIVSPLAMVAQRLIDHVTEESDDAGGPYNDALNDANELVTQDVARWLRALLEAETPAPSDDADREGAS